jgi:hypothetical protein
MSGRSTFVSIAMAITLFVSQVAALSACWIPMPAMQEIATGDPGMTANMAVGIQRGPVSGSCCELSAANAQSVAVLRIPEYGVTRLATTSDSSNLEAPPTAVRAAPAKAPPRGPGSSLQATFCVFLI